MVLVPIPMLKCEVLLIPEPVKGKDSQKSYHRFDYPQGRPVHKDVPPGFFLVLFLVFAHKIATLMPYNPAHRTDRLPSYQLIDY